MQNFIIRTFIIVQCSYVLTVQGYVHHKRETNADFGPSAEPKLELPEKLRPRCNEFLKAISTNPEVCKDLGSEVVASVSSACHSVIDKGCKHVPAKEESFCKKTLHQYICFESSNATVTASDKNATANGKHESMFADKITGACESTVQPLVNKMNQWSEKYGSDKMCDSFVAILKDACRAGIVSLLSDSPITALLIPFLPGYICG